MKKLIIILLLFLLPFAQAEPLATSYWGYVTVDSTPRPNALVTVLDSSGKEIARSTSTSNAMYQVMVAWDDAATQADEGVTEDETLTFNVDGKTATTKKIDQKGTNNRLDLTISTSSTTTSSKTTASSTTIISPKTTASAPAATTSHSPIASPDVTAVSAKITETPASATSKSTPGFGFVLAIAGLMAVILRKSVN